MVKITAFKLKDGRIFEDEERAEREEHLVNMRGKLIGLVDSLASEVGSRVLSEALDVNVEEVLNFLIENRDAFRRAFR